MTTPAVTTCAVTGNLKLPDGTPATDVQLTFTPVQELGGSWAADAIIVDEVTVSPDSNGAISLNLVAGTYFRLTITAPGERPSTYRVATPINGTPIDLMEMIAVGRYGWGPPGNMPMPGWGFGPGWF